MKVPSTALDDPAVPQPVAEAYKSLHLSADDAPPKMNTGSGSPNEPSMLGAIRVLDPLAGDLATQYLLSRATRANSPLACTSMRSSKLKVGVIGGGISGLIFATHLGNLGLEVKVFDQKASSGGTWSLPHYPGQRVDIAGHVYWPTHFEPTSWRSIFPTASELAKRLAAQTKNLEPHCGFVFNSKVTDLKWQGETASWRVRHIDTHSRLSFEEEFDFVVLAPGKLSSPVFPLGPDAGPRTGQHSSGFEISKIDSTKPICIVGSAASGIQLATQLSIEGYRVHLFQRSPSWILPTPSYRQESAPLVQQLQKADPLFSLLYRLYYVAKSIRGNLDSVLAESGGGKSNDSLGAKNSAWRFELEDYIRSQTLGSQLPLEWLIPNYPPGSRRLVLDDGQYLSSVLEGRIKLHGASDIRDASDIRTALRIGNSVPENLVWATGFNPSAWTEQVSVVGETNESMHSLIYKSGLHYKGVMVPGFPNLFLGWGPNTNVVVSGSNTHMMELQAEFTGKIITAMAKDGYRRVSVGNGVSHDYARLIALRSTEFAWGAHPVASWYKTAEGLSIENWPGDTADYFKELIIDTLDGLDFL
jgi:4-hydroxyacetophenone monooxygenase